MRDKVQNGTVKFGLTPGTYVFVVARDESRGSAETVEPDRPLVIRSEEWNG